MAMRARLDRQASPLRFGVRCGTEDRLNMLRACSSSSKKKSKSHGWYTADLRKLAVSYRRGTLSPHGDAFFPSLSAKDFFPVVFEEEELTVVLLERPVA